MMKWYEIIFVMVFLIIFTTTGYNQGRQEQPVPICEAPIINLSCPKTEYSCNIPELSCPKPFCDVTCPSCPKDIILDTIKDVPYMREYEYGVWDCTEMSNEIVRRFKEIGFKSEVVMGVVDCESDRFNCTDTARHDWVKLQNIYIEATTGTIIHPDDYEIYNIR